MPTVCKISLDASEYRSELAKVIAGTKEAQNKLASKSGVKDQTVTISVANHVPKAAETAKKALNSIPDKKDIKVSAEGADKAAFSIRNIWKEMTSLEGGAKKAVASMITGGGLIGIAFSGIQGVIKVCTTLYDNFIQKGKDAAQAHRDMASSISEAAANNERLKASANSAVSQLSQLASVEKMNNAQTAQAVSLVAELTKQYGDLGVSVDQATGRIKGLGSAIVAKQEKDAQREIAALQAQIKSLQNANQQEDKNIGDAGFNVSKMLKATSWANPIGAIMNLTGMTDKIHDFLGIKDLQIGGEQDAKEAGARKAENTKQLMEVRMKLREAQKRQAEIAKNQLLKTQGENAALEQQQQERQDQQTYKNADNELNRTKDVDQKIANRQALIAGEQTRNNDLRSKTAAAKAQMDQYAPGTAGADAQKYEDAKKVFLQNSAEQAKSDEKIAGWNEQIKQLQYEQSEAKSKLLSQAKYEAEYHKLIASGQYEKAEALKLEKELKDQNLKLTKQETDEILKQRKAQASAKLQGSLKDQAQNLLWDSMKQNGMGQAAAQQKALADAEKTKGSALTTEESKLVTKLADLTYAMQNQRDVQLGDTSIKTNSLTARGGFQGGAVVPDTDRVNKAIQSTVKSMQQQQRDIRDLVDEIKKALT